MKRKVLVLIVLLTSGILLSGCSMKEEAQYYEGEGDEYSKVDTSPQEPAPEIDEPDINGGDVVLSADIPALENRKIIYTSSLVMEDPEPSEVYSDVVALLDTYSAYIESANITSERYIVKIRVLSANFTDFVEEIKTSGDLLSFTKSSQDVTNAYSTFEARKLALETQHTRILELLAEAVDLNTILILEDARFEIETELNQVGNSLANYDSLVDFSTINLTIRKTNEQVVILPRTEEPGVMLEEKGIDYINLEVRNYQDYPVVIQVDLLINGEFQQQYEKEAYADSTAVFSIAELDSNKEYTFKVTALASEHTLSQTVTRKIKTEPTFFNNIGNTFVSSFNLLVTFFEYSGYVVTALLPFTVVGVVVFFPVRYLIKKRKNDLLGSVVNVDKVKREE